MQGRKAPAQKLTLAEVPQYFSSSRVKDITNTGAPCTRPTRDDRPVDVGNDQREARLAFLGDFGIVTCPAPNGSFPLVATSAGWNLAGIQSGTLSNTLGVSRDGGVDREWEGEENWRAMCVSGRLRAGEVVRKGSLREGVLWLAASDRMSIEHVPSPGLKVIHLKPVLPSRSDAACLNREFEEDFDGPSRWAESHEDGESKGKGGRLLANCGTGLIGPQLMGTQWQWRPSSAHCRRYTTPSACFSTVPGSLLRAASRRARH
ncbi:hypothetical protein FB45DRAFT_1015031 [Roridomyces roridus]|uniref:Uncharacterized protein n=1 Tax=Roridomyces roridus TaxID=1738132 RepID=A0AAD7AXH0_9AGAR|nr:hypothetical protein FB45DRAFT_1015031 [Roridomyces roridus]